MECCHSFKQILKDFKSLKTREADVKFFRFIEKTNAAFYLAFPSPW